MTAPVVHSAKELRDLLLMQLQVRIVHISRRPTDIITPVARARHDAEVKALRSLYTYLEAIVIDE